MSRLLSELPCKWEKLGDLAMLPRTCMASPDWDRMGQPLWRLVADALGVQRLAMQAPVANTGDISACAGLSDGCGLTIYCTPSCAYTFAKD